ncbi:MAG: hypothetical protein HQ477_07700 [Chloroflexi bacterium]|nr:hypothetical protein [Chloroflexota bacterium]
MTHVVSISNRTTAFAFSVIIVSLAIFIATVVAVVPVRADASHVLTITSQTADIDYGEKITITTTVDAGSYPAEIEAVRALFRPQGGSTIWSYSYPEYSVGGAISGEISVTFDIPTGPGSYYPPGTEFDIEIEVTNRSGETSSVISPTTVEYLDPAKNWERVQGNGYTVVYYGVARSRVEDLVAAVDSRIPTLEATLGITDPPDFKAVVFPSVQEATPSFPPVSQTATDQFLFAGFAQPEYRLFVQGQMNATTFTHELAHLYTHEAVVSSFLSGIPSWLNEGLSRFLETGSSESSNARLRSSVRPDELLSLSHMQTIPGQRSDVSIFYPQAGAFVGYLVDEYSHAGMADLLGEVNKGRSIQRAFELIYHKPLYEVENDWRKLFNADPLPIPSATVEVSDAVGEKIPNTPVPLVDYEAAAGNPQPTSTVAPATLPTVTPETPPLFDQTDSIEEYGTNWAIAGIVIGLSIITGIWLFTSRRKIPKHNS